jgi:hypothetical protein
LAEPVVHIPNKGFLDFGTGFFPILK